MINVLLRLRMSARCFQDSDGSRGREEGGEHFFCGNRNMECLAELFGRRGAFRQSQQKQTSMALGRHGLV